MQRAKTLQCPHAPAGIVMLIAAQTCRAAGRQGRCTRQLHAVAAPLPKRGGGGRGLTAVVRGLDKGVQDVLGFPVTERGEGAYNASNNSAFTGLPSAASAGGIVF